MRNDKLNLTTFTYVFAFLIGVILFWSFGKNWLNLESKLIFLARLIDIAVAVILFGGWNIIRHSSYKDD